MKSLGGKFGIAVLVLLSASAAQAKLTYEGHITQPDGTPLNGSVNLKVQIRSPGVENCLLYEETFTKTATNGYVSVILDDGAGARSDGLGHTFADSFKNVSTFSGLTCDSGTTYSPVSTDGRELVLHAFIGSQWEIFPAVAVNAVPYSLESKSLAGYPGADYVRVVGGASPLSNANFNALLALAAGTSAMYQQYGKLQGVTLPAMTNGHALGWSAGAWVSFDPLTGVQAFAKTALPTCGVGDFLRDNGSGGLVCATPAGGGSVTSVIAGAGLSGGTVTSTGTISLPVLGAGGTAIKVTYDTYGRITAAGSLAEADIPTLSAPGKVSASAITSGTFGGSVAMNVSGNIVTTGSVNATSVGANSISVSGSLNVPLLESTNVHTGNLKVFDNDLSNWLSFRSPDVVSANQQWILPATDGTSNQVLTTNGAGSLSWTTASGGGLSLAGGSMTGTLKLAGAPASPADAANKAYVDNASSSKLSVTGGTVSGTFAVAGVGLKAVSIDSTDSSGDSKVDFRQSGVSVGSVGYRYSDNSLTLDSSGLGAVNLSTDGTTRLTVDSVWGGVGIGTTAPDSGARLDVRGGAIAAGSQSASLGGEVRFYETGGQFNYVALRAPSSIAANTTWLLPAADGSAGQVLSTNGAGALSWVTPISGGSGTPTLTFTGDVTGTGTTNITMSLATVPIAKLSAINQGQLLGRFNTSVGPVEALTLGPNFPLSGSTIGLNLLGATLSSGHILFGNGSGQAASAPPSGDLTMNASGQFQVVSLGSLSAVTLANVVNSRTPSAFVNTLVERDGVGGFSANEVRLENSGTLSLRSPFGAGYVMTLPQTAGASGDILKSMGNGTLSWMSPSALGDFKADGSVSMTGSLKLPNGSAGSPAIGWPGSVSGLFFATAPSNRIGFSVNSIEQMTVTSAGNLGVGTTSPSARLDVNSGAGGTYAKFSGSNTFNTLLLENTAGGSWNNSITFAASGFPKWEIGNDATGSMVGNFYLYDHVSGQERLRVDSAGNVGIGTTTMNGRMHVNGSIVMSGATTGYTGFQAPATSPGVIYTLPSASPVGSESVLVSNGSGILNWVSPAARILAADNTAVGNLAMPSVTGSNNTAVGSNAMSSATTGSMNVAVGDFALAAVASAMGNTAVGNQSLNFATGNYNTALGMMAGANVTSGASNILIGKMTGGNTLTTGSSNILIGNNIDVAAGTVSNQLNIGGLLTGDLAAKRIGIGGFPMSAKLELQDSITASASSVTGIKTSTQINSAITIPTVTGVRSDINAAVTSSSVTTAYGFFANMATGSGNISTGYGFYMPTWSGGITNRYGFYIADTAANNYIAGKLGIGLTSPSEALDVSSGNVKAATFIAMSGGAPGGSCAGFSMGTIGYNSTNQTVVYCDGTNWRGAAQRGPASTAASTNTFTFTGASNKLSINSPSGPTITLNGILDGEEYTVMLTSTSNTTYSFSIAGCTLKYRPVNAAVAAASTAAYRITRMGSTCLVDWGEYY